MKKLTKTILLLMLVLIGLASCTEEVTPEKPTITGFKKEYTLSVGDEFSPLKGIKATDQNSVDVTKNLDWFGYVPVDNENKLTTEGSYTYSIVYLEDGQIILEEEVTLTVTNPNKPIDLKPVLEVADEFKNIDKKVSGDGYKIVWSDEFDVNGAPKSENWGYNIGNGNWGWGNGEKQYYTDRSENVTVKDGKLIITAKKENFGGFEYTSTRIVSQKKVDFCYGRLEFMAKLPKGAGTWPALWMMPTDSRYGGWPNSGEIDVMEHVGNRQDYVLGTCHSNRYNGGNGKGTTIYRQGVCDNFNLYSVEWTPDKLTFLFNDVPYYTYQNPKYSSNNHEYFPYDQNFYIIMNIAMGGTLGGNIDPNFTSTSMEIDYVRLYQKDYTGTDKTAPSNVKVNGNATNNTINLTWNKTTDNVCFKHYEVFVNGTSVGATTKTNYTVTNLTPNTEYTINVLAVDMAGNYSVSEATKISTTGSKTINNPLIVLKKEEIFAY